MHKRTFLGALVACTLAGSAAAQGWPERPVHVVVPAPAGSSLDVVVRTLGEKLRERWKQPIVVDNKPGAGGLLGMDVVAKAPPDGLTLGIGFNGPIAFAPFLYSKLPYDPAKDLAPIVLATSQPNVLAVQAGNPAKTLPQFVAWAKTQGDRLNYASVGNGSSSHLTAELFAIESGLHAVHVPYNGSPPAATSVAAGETQFVFAVAPALLPMVQAGKLRLLAVTSRQRLASLPEVPTLAEQGLPGFEALAWNGLFAPAATPAALIERINADINAALRESDVREAFARQGLIVGGGSPAEFKALIERDAKKWGAIITRAGIRLE
ncbi:MAG: Bug family tripartite tricarboxylate transporter substrate binding protein [Betaproteobacteria bacterium]